MKALVRRTGLVLAVVAAVVALSIPAAASEVTGAVTGTVKDSSGGVVPGVTVTLVRQGTNLPQAQSTRADGAFRFNAVPPGTYSVTASLDGFKTASQAGIVVTIGSVARADFALELGAVSEVVSVVADANQIDTSKAVVATHVDEQMVRDLPIISRSVLKLADMAPGVIMENNGGTLLKGGEWGASVDGAGYGTTNGTRRAQSAFFLDSSDNSASWRGGSLGMPNPDAVQEVTVTTSGASAEFGRQPGAVINVVTKSGTNAFHGSIGVNMHDEKLNANSWSANKVLKNPTASAADKAKSARPNDDQRWITATLGGPLVKDRTFFFASYQNFGDNAAYFMDNMNAPTPAMLNGDFSAIPGFNVKIVNPATGQPYGDQIPTSHFDPVAKALLPLLPTVNRWWDDKYTFNGEAPLKSNDVTLRVDHAQGAHHRLTLSYMGGFGRNENPIYGGNRLAAWGPYVDSNKQHTASLRHNWFLRDNLVVETTAGVGFLKSERTNESPSGKRIDDLVRDATGLSMNWPADGVSPSLGVSSYLPRIQWTDLPQGLVGYLDDIDQKNYRLLTSVSWLRGAHSVKAGVEWNRRWHQISNRNDSTSFNYGGQFSYNGDQGGNQASGSIRGAYAFADFLLGRAQSFSVGGRLETAFWQNVWSAYVQDQWKVSPKLTLNYGLRYEYNAGWNTSLNEFVTFNPSHRSNTYPTLPIGFAVLGDTGYEDGLFTPDRNDFAPRFGLAFDPQANGKTVIRASAGIYYSGLPNSVSEQFNGGGVFSRGLSGSNSLGMLDPWASSTTTPGNRGNLQYPNGVAQYFPLRPMTPTDPYTKTNQGPRALDPDGFTTPYAYQFNASVERELLRGVTVELGYVGNRGRNFAIWKNINLGEFVSTPAGAAPTSNNVADRRPYYTTYFGQGFERTFGGMVQLSFDENTRYDSLVFTSNLKRGPLNGRITYVLQDSNAMLPVGQDIVYGSSNNGVNLPYYWGSGEMAGNLLPRHVLRSFAVVSLPRLRDKSPLLRAIAGGWQISGMFYFQTGTPLTLGTFDWNMDGIGSDRPNVNGDIKYVFVEDPASGKIQYFDTSNIDNRRNSAGPTADTWKIPGTARVGGVIGPKTWTLDAGMQKVFTFGGSKELALRIDAVNVLNHVNLGNPVVDSNSGDFGRITGRSNSLMSGVGDYVPPRKVQFGTTFRF